MKISKLKIALKIANIEGKIKSLKDGINSIVGVDGLNFSGGERQRIAIARAIYKDPEILFLDEFTSAIDSKTQSMILYQLLKYFKNISNRCFVLSLSFFPLSKIGCTVECVSHAIIPLCDASITSSIIT